MVSFYAHGMKVVLMAYEQKRREERISWDDNDDD